MKMTLNIDVLSECEEVSGKVCMEKKVEEKCFSLMTFRKWNSDNIATDVQSR